MAHIHTKTNEYDLTVTAYIVRNDGPKPRIMLHMHKKHNMLLPVGGHVETTENPWQAVVRELGEESGYNVGQLSILQPKHSINSLPSVVLHPCPVVTNSHHITKDHLHTDIAYAFIVSSDAVGSIDSGESTDIRWLDKNQLNRFNPNQIYPNTLAVCNFILDVSLTEWDIASCNNFI